MAKFKLSRVVQSFYPGLQVQVCGE